MFVCFIFYFYYYKHINNFNRIDILLVQNEWRAIGVQRSHGWVHYAIHHPEPHIMLFRRPLNYQQNQQQQAGAQSQPMVGKAQ